MVDKYQPIVRDEAADETPKATKRAAKKTAEPEPVDTPAQPAESEEQ